MIKAVERRVLGVNKERTPVEFLTCGRLGHTTVICYMSRPCLKCGRYGHLPSNCWGKNPTSRTKRLDVNEIGERGGSRQILIPHS